MFTHAINNNRMEVYFNDSIVESFPLPSSSGSHATLYEGTDKVTVVAKDTKIVELPVLTPFGIMIAPFTISVTMKREYRYIPESFQHPECIASASLVTATISMG